MAAEVDPSGHKRDLRRRLREERRGLDASWNGPAARAVEALAPLHGLRTLLGYLASDGEVPVTRLLLRAREAGTTVLLPRVRGDGGLDLVVAPNGGDLVAAAREGREPDGFLRGRGGILEPVGPAVDPARLLLPATVIVPAVAFARDGNRLGRGGGAYDRALGSLRRLGWRAIGVCHARHLLDELPREAHDVPVDAVLTEEGLLEVARPSGGPDLRS